MSHVQFAPPVPDDIRLAQKMLIGGQNAERLAMLDSIDSGKPINEMICYNTRFGLEEYLETTTVVVSL